MPESTTQPATFDRQAFFTKAVTRWAERGFKRSIMPTPATGEFTICAYRDKDGNACLIGLCIPDEVYQPAFEDKSIEALLRMADDDDAWVAATFGVPVSEMTDDDVQFIAELQSIHDGSPMVTVSPLDGETIPTDSEAMPWPAVAVRRLKRFAQRHGVQMPEGVEARDT